MPSKTELMNEAEMLGLEVDATMTKAAIEARIASAHADGTLDPEEEKPVPVAPQKPHPAKRAAPDKDAMADYSGEYKLNALIRIGEKMHYPGEVVHLGDPDARVFLRQKSCEPV
jgi:hypothetical protein